MPTQLGGSGGTRTRDKPACKAGAVAAVPHPHRLTTFAISENRAGFAFPRSPAFSSTEDPRGAFDVSRSASNRRMAIHAVGYAAPWVRCSPSSAQHVLGTSPTSDSSTSCWLANKAVHLGVEPSVLADSAAALLYPVLLDIISTHFHCLRQLQCILI